MNNINLAFFGLILSLPAVVYLVILALTSLQNKQKTTVPKEALETQVIYETDGGLEAVS